MSTRLVIFDVDGTLIDSQQQILASMSYAFEAAALPVPPREAVLSVVGLSLPEAMARLAPHLPRAATEALADNYRASFVRDRAEGAPGGLAPLYPGARAVLERLSAKPRTRLGIATGKARRGLDHVFAGHDLAGFFATVQTSDTHPSKPDPSMVRQALDEAGCLAGRAVMVGDTTFDIEMGRAAGVATVGVAWGYHAREALEAAGADLVIDTFGALDAAVASLLAAPA